MKKITLSFALLALAASVSFATIRRVNPSPGIAGTNVYSTVLAAVTAAVANDTIQLEPFAGAGNETAYGESITLTKKLIFLGAGYELDNPQLSAPPADKRWCYLGSIIFNNGSANSAVIGLAINSVSIFAPNVIITRCRLNGIQLGKSTNVISGVNSYGLNAQITRNLIGNLSGLNSAPSDIITGTYISNNYFVNTINTMINAVIRNNIFSFGFNNTGNFIRDVDNSSITNNIFRGINAGQTITDINSTGNSLGNNLVTNFNLLPSNNGNINGADPSSIFVDTNWFNYSIDQYLLENALVLAPSSPAIGTGTGGIDMGMYGGNSPYLKSGLPPYPIITDATNTGLGNPSVPISVNVSIRSNN